jgi:hypothetical protein
MGYKAAALALAGCLAILLGFGSLSLAASDNAKIANLKFSGPVSEADQKYLGLKNHGNFSLQEIQAPYVLIEIMRTT